MFTLILERRDDFTGKIIPLKSITNFPSEVAAIAYCQQHHTGNQHRVEHEPPQGCGTVKPRQHRGA